MTAYFALIWRVLTHACICLVYCRRAGEHVGGSPIQMTVLANVASTKYSQVTALVPTLTAGMQVPVVSIKLRDRFLNARTTSGDGRRLCIRVRSVNTSDYYSCSICIAKPMDESNESQHSRCQLGPCGRVCSSDEHGGFEWLYNRSIASRLIVEALLVASDFVSCGSGRCVPVAACSNMGEMLPVYDRCSALNMDHAIGRPSLLTIVPGRTGPPFCFLSSCAPCVHSLRIRRAALSGCRCIQVPDSWHRFGHRANWCGCFI